MNPIENVTRMSAMLQFLCFLLIFCLIALLLITGWLLYKKLPIRSIFLLETWKTILWPFFKKHFLGTTFVAVFLGLFTNFLSSLIFPGYENEILNWNRQISHSVTRIEENQNAQQKQMDDQDAIIRLMAEKLGISEEEYKQLNEKAIEDSQKVPVADISEELQAEIDAYLSEYKYEEARQAIDEFLDNHEQKDLARLHYQKSLTYEAEINYPKAKEELETAIALDKQNPDILHQYGFILNIMGEYDKSIEYYERALKIDLKVFGDAHPNVAAC